MVRRHGHFGGANEIELVFGEKIRLVLPNRKIGCTHHRLVFHQVRHDQRRKSFAYHVVQSELQHRLLQEHASILQEIRARSGQLHCPRDVDDVEVFAKLNMITRGKVKACGVLPRS